MEFVDLTLFFTESLSIVPRYLLVKLNGIIYWLNLHYLFICFFFYSFTLSLKRKKLQLFKLTNVLFIPQGFFFIQIMVVGKAEKYARLFDQ